MNNAPPIAESFARILRWADAHLPLLRQSLRPPASEGDLQSFEALLGQTLPQDVRELYRLADGQIPFQFGQTPYYPGLFVSLPFNPLETVTRHWRQARELEAEFNSDEFLSSFPPDAIKIIDSNRGWIPISDDAGGNHIAIDLDPGPAGNFGQVIITGTDEQERVRVASSLSAFLHWAAGEFEAGHFTGSGEDGEWRWRNEGHLHDGLRTHLKAGGQIG